jgi:hypothetical protein
MTTKTTADQRIRQATATVVLTVAGFAAAVIYLHIRDLTMANGQTSMEIQNYLRSLRDGSARQTATAEA